MDEKTPPAVAGKQAQKPPLRDSPWFRVSMLVVGVCLIVTISRCVEAYTHPYGILSDFLQDPPSSQRWVALQRAIIVGFENVVFILVAVGLARLLFGGAKTTTETSDASGETS